jgi:hypothetical protein
LILLEVEEALAGTTRPTTKSVSVEISTAKTTFPIMTADPSLFQEKFHVKAAENEESLAPCEMMDALS